jgi:cytochrome c-type biogenesis protein CcmH/NrfF
VRRRGAAGGRGHRLILAFAISYFLASLPAFAVMPSERLADPALEARARALSQELRCLVCQNQSIDDSNADLAHDLRVLVRERLTAGDSDAQVLAYLTSRYGDYVLLIGWRRRAASSAVATSPLSADEQRRLADLLDEGG